MRIGIVAGESSGDLLGAGLIAAIREQYPEAIFEGIAGPGMVAQGCTALYPSEKLSIMGLVEVLGHYRELRGIREQLYQHFLQSGIDVFVGIDAPEFNLGLEEKLHKAGIKTVQYVSPQVWAWRQHRVKQIARAVDKVLALFPFEVDFYRQHNVDVEYVGHPLADMIAEHVDVQACRHRLGLPNDKKLVALMPGSRVSEVSRLLLPFLQTARWCNDRHDHIGFVIPVANTAVEPLIQQAITDSEVQVTIVNGRSRDVMAASDVVLMASGTATLEGLLLKKPMVVAYRVAWLTYQLLKFWVKLPYISLPNLLAGRRAVPEVLQNDVRPDILGPLVLNFLDNPDEAGQLVDTFATIHTALRQGTNHKAAAAVLSLIDQ